MAYENLQGYISMLPYVGKTISSYINGLDSAFKEPGWTEHYKKGQFVSFIYDLIFRGPLVLLGNLIAAPLDALAFFADIVSGHEKDNKKSSICDWKNAPFNSLLHAIGLGIFGNVVWHTIELVLNGIWAGIKTPLKALTKAAVNVGFWLGCGPKEKPMTEYDFAVRAALDSGALDFLLQSGNLPTVSNSNVQAANEPESLIGAQPPATNSFN